MTGQPNIQIKEENIRLTKVILIQGGADMEKWHLFEKSKFMQWLLAQDADFYTVTKKRFIPAFNISTCF